MTFVLCALCAAAHVELGPVHQSISSKAEWVLWVVTLQANTPLFHQGLQSHHQLRTTHRFRR